MLQKSLLVALFASTLALSAHARQHYRTYVSVDAQVARISSTAEIAGVSEKGTSTFGGGSLAAGAYFGEGLGYGKGTEFDDYSAIGVHQVGVEIGILTQSETDSVVKEEYLLVPLLASYNYNFILPDNMAQIYVGPSLGAVILRADLTAPGFKAADSAVAAAAGFQAGVKVPVSRNLTVDAGYRYLRTTDMDFDFGAGAKVKMKDLGGHFFNVGVTYVF